MTTVVYGEEFYEWCSVIIEGDLSDKAYYEQSDHPDEESGNLLVASDGTILAIRCHKDERMIWEIRLLEKGSLFDRIEQCCDAEAETPSDKAFFRDGLTWAYVSGGEFSRVSNEQEYSKMISRRKAEDRTYSNGVGPGFQLEEEEEEEQAGE